MSIVFLRESPSFQREEIVDMAHAVDDICMALEISADDAPSMKSVAERVVEHAKRGERNPEVLAERVISEMRAEKNKAETSTAETSTAGTGKVETGKVDSPETAPSA